MEAIYWVEAHMFDNPVEGSHPSGAWINIQQFVTGTTRDYPRAKRCFECYKRLVDDKQAARVWLIRQEPNQSAETVLRYEEPKYD